MRDRVYEIANTKPGVWEVQAQQWLDPTDPRHEQWATVAVFEYEHPEMAARQYVGEVLYRQGQLDHAHRECAAQPATPTRTMCPFCLSMFSETGITEHEWSCAQRFREGEKS